MLNVLARGQTLPPQHQKKQPGVEKEMHPKPQFEDPAYKGSSKLLDKVALITGGDSGIGRAVAVAYAKEGCDVVIAYLDEHEDAKETEFLVKKEGRSCVIFSGDIGDEAFCQSLIKKTISEFGRLDVLINNAGVQYPQKSIENITSEQWEHTFKTNIFSFFYLTKAALPYLKKGSCIINSASITAYKGHPTLIDYSSTKGAIVSFTRSLSLSLADAGVRANAVAPGPIWTPLIPASFSAEEVGEFGKDVPMKRAGQPGEIAACYVFLASSDASYISGQVLHPNGGVIVNG